MESRIRQAMKSRLQHFKDQADSLTFEGVRRLLEKDMVLDTYALDSHKKFVKQLLEKFLSGAEEEDDDSKGEDVNKSNGSGQTKLEDEPVKEAKVEDSPVMGLLSETQGDTNDNIPTEDMIKEAIWNKADYFRSKSEELTVVSVRRLLEEDLKLQKFSLDSFKKLISKQLDEVLNSQSNNDDADSSPSHEVKPKKKSVVKEKVQKSEEPKKRKKPAQEIEKPKKKKTKDLSVEKNNGHDQSSDESSGVKKEVVAPVYGKKVERLKSIIKACGMTVAPTVYKKAKQAPEDKREAILIKELKEILSKEGISTDPSEKEIKEVKRRKERAKELEGIDTSNIVLGSRRRSTTFPPPRPVEPVESDSDDDDSENEDGSEDGDGSDDENGSKDGDEGVNATQSEEEVHAETFDSD